MDTVEADDLPWVDRRRRTVATADGDIVEESLWRRHTRVMSASPVQVSSIVLLRTQISSAISSGVI